MDRHTNLKTLDKLCDNFESQWQAGNRPAIADYIGRLPEAGRQAAFRDLLVLEVAYRCDKGECPEVADYERPFPQFADQIRVVFRETRAHGDTAVVDETIDTVPKRNVQELPAQFEGYEVLEEVARGGMGVVYKAHRQSLDRTVALKVVLSGETPLPQIVDRFIAEAKTVAKLQHPGIVTIHEVGQAHGRPYFSMEYVEGQTLSELLSDGPLTQVQAARYIREIADAIHFAHEQGVLHRDIKPSNVMVDQLGRLRVMDFGLAKQVEGNTNLTSSGQILGTPGFMSPEQARGEHEKLDRRSDVYALGALLYSMLTGNAPFESESIAELMAKVIRDEPAPLRKVKSDIDRDLERICLQCLAKNPNDRLNTADAVATEVGRYLSRQGSLRRTPSVGGMFTAVAVTAALVLVAAIVIVIKLRDKEIAIKTDSDTNIEIQGERVTVTNDVSSQR